MELSQAVQRLKEKLFNLFRYEEDIEHLKRLLEQIESGLLKAQAIIDKKQSQIDLKTKEKDQLILAKNGAALSPLEADIERTKTEIEATQNFCAAAKKTWLKYQNEFIDLVRTHHMFSRILNFLFVIVFQEKI